MKNRLIGAPVLVAALCLTLFMCSAVPAFCGGFVFGVRPGTTVESAYFGFRSGTIVPFVGIDFLSASVTIEDVEASASMYVPNFGARVYFNSNLAGGAVAPYLQGTFLKSFASVSVEDLEAELLDSIGELLSFWGFSVAFGAEYFFTDHFSVGGEYGLRYIKTSSQVEVSIDIIEDPIELDSDLAISYGASYANVTVNFHF